jgi:hypothetical protein
MNSLATAGAARHSLGVAGASALVLAALPNFDLTNVMTRVARKNPGWTQKRLDAAENAYRMFCARAKAAPHEEQVVMKQNADMDEVWHSHILHTREYTADCMQYFGYFLHHVPLSGDEKCKSCKDGSCHGNPDCLKPAPDPKSRNVN